MANPLSEDLRIRLVRAVEVECRAVRLGRDAVVSGDHDDADACFPAAADRFSYLRSWGVDHADEPEQFKLAFDLVGGCCRLREYAAGE